MPKNVFYEVTENDLYKLLKDIKPDLSFDKDLTIRDVDYTNLNNWAAHPKLNNEQFYIPNNSYKTTKKNDIDVFFIHGTGFYGKEWNFNMNKESAAYERTEIMMANQASVFNDSCNIYAPEYRQATYFSFFDKETNGIKAFDLAYRDIEESFNCFINQFNNGRPFILAGHSQGALHLSRLIHNKVLNNKLKNNLICAYPIGYILPEIYFNEIYPNMSFSHSYNDTNCIVTWATIMHGYKRTWQKVPLWKPSGWSSQKMNQKLISTNPFSWNDDVNWQKPNNSHLSTMIKTTNYNYLDRLSQNHSGEKKSIVPSAIQDFQIRINTKTGLIEAKGDLIDRISKVQYFTGDLHSFDISLFWGSFRQNIKDRINAFIK